MRVSLLLLIVLMIGGCASSPPVYNTEVKFSHTPLTLDAVVLPPPLDLPVIPCIENKGTHWELCHDGWAALVAWQLESDRYFRDLRQTWIDTLGEVDSHNAANEPPAQPAEEEAPEEAKPSWWKDW